MRSTSHGDVSMMYTDKNHYSIICSYRVTAIHNRCIWKFCQVYMTFADLNIAFGTVSRDGIRKTIAKFRWLTRFIVIMWQFHDGMVTQVQNDGEYRYL